MNEQQLAKASNDAGFIAALDQSGGSSPKALGLYGIEEGTYSGRLLGRNLSDLVDNMGKKSVQLFFRSCCSSFIYE